MKFARRIPIVRWMIVLQLDLTTTALKRLLAAIQQLKKNDAQRYQKISKSNQYQMIY